MNLKIENVGLIKSANIALNGLTVIGGENDTGKSTVGKLIFALVKAVNRYEQDFGSLDRNKILKLADRLNQERLQARKSNSKISSLLASTLSQLFRFLDGYHPILEDTDLLSLRTTLDKAIEQFEQEPDGKKYAHLLEEFKHTTSQKEDKNIAIKKALRRALISEFYLELSPKHDKKSVSKIAIQENEGDILAFEMMNNELTDLELKEDALYFDDVTFLETPILLQMYELISNADTLFDISDKRSRLNSLARPTAALHIKDLMNKLIKARYFAELNLDNESPSADLMKQIEKIVHGSFNFEEGERDFIFNKKWNGAKKTSIKSVNTASGIKSFGMIQLLLQSGLIDHRSLVILDEPETHLHPKWQVEYARLIVELVKQNISFLVTSHSPYLIQALKRFSEKGEIQDRTHFYLTEIEENGIQAHFTDVSQNLNKLFLKLSEPLRLLL
jgi:predicted ATPase